MIPNILIFNFVAFYKFQTHGCIFRKDGCMRSYGMVRFTCIGIGSEGGKRVCSNTLFHLLDCSKLEIKILI
jgi:hypothetical protein